MDWRRLDHAVTDVPRLTRRQEIDLSARARAGDRDARDTMILSCYPLLVRMCGRVKCEPGDRADFISCAVFSLMRAVDGYEAGRGFRLSTYAGRGIAFAVRNWLERRGRNREYPMERVDSFDEFPAAPGDGEPECEADERHEAARLAVLDAIRDLPPRHLDVLRCRVMADHPETLVSLGRRHGVTKERIRQIESQALDMVRRRLTRAMRLEGKPCPG